MGKPEKPSNQVIGDGKRAELILNDPVYLEAVERLETRWIAEWRKGNTPAERRGKLWDYMQALEEVKQALESILTDGVIEAATSRRITTR